MDIKDLFKLDDNRIWDITVPYIKKDNVTHVYLTTEVQEPEYYNEICFHLMTASADEVFEFHLNTPGGMIDSAFMLIDAIKASPARTIAHLTGTVASAGTIITLACDEVKVADHTSWMSHNYSAGMHGKGHEMKARQNHMDESLNAAFREFYAGFYTETEMQEIIDGKDSWLTKDEVLRRWDNRKDYLSKLSE